MSYKPRFPILSQIGLNETAAQVYELLLTRGRSPAHALVKESGLGRGNVYNVLAALVRDGFAHEIEGTKTLYEAAPPSALAALIDRERARVEQVSSAFTGALPLLSSEYRLSVGKPAIRAFEGIDGFERALADSLAGGEEILATFDPAAVRDEFARVNERYVAKRRAARIPKRILLPDVPESRDYAARMGGAYTDIRILSGFPGGFFTASELYGDHVSFLTLTPERVVSVIVDDAHVAAFERARFEYQWKGAREV